MKFTCILLILISLVVVSQQAPVAIPNDLLTQDATYGVPAGGAAGVSYFQTEMLFGYDATAKKPVTANVALDLSTDQIILGAVSKVDCTGDFCTPSTTASTPTFQDSQLTATTGTIAAGFLKPDFDYSQKANVVQTAYNNATDIPLTSAGVIGINTTSVFLTGLSQNYKFSTAEIKPFTWFSGALSVLSDKITFSSVKVNYGAQPKYTIAVTAGTATENILNVAIDATKDKDGKTPFDAVKQICLTSGFPKVMSLTKSVYDATLAYINGIVCPEKATDCKPDDLSKVPALKLTISNYVAPSDNTKKVESARLLQGASPAVVNIEAKNYVYQKADKTLALAAAIVADGTEIPGCGTIPVALNDAFYIQFPSAFSILDGKRIIAFGSKASVNPGSGSSTDGGDSNGLSIWIIALIIIIVIVIIIVIGGVIFYFVKVRGGDDYYNN